MAAGAQKSGGSMTMMTSGRRTAQASSRGRLDRAKVARCSRRLSAPGLGGTHSGARRILTPRQDWTA